MINITKTTANGRKFILLAMLSPLLVAGVWALPLLDAGDGSKLFLKSVVGLRLDDNIFLATDDTPKSKDLIFEVTPGLDFTFGRNAKYKGSFVLSESFTRYVDNADLNTQLWDSSYSSNYEDGKLKFNLAAGFHELNQNSVDIRGLTRRDQTNSNLDGELFISEKTAAAAGFFFERIDYKRAGYSSADILTFPLGLYYRWTSKLDLSLGYRHRDTRVNLGADSQDNYFNVGARGDFTPKLTGYFNVGYNRRSLNRGAAETQLGLEADIVYELTAKTNLTLVASNDFATSASGAQQRNLTLNSFLSAKISEMLNVSGGLAYRGIDNITRFDDYYEGTLDVTCVLRTSLKIVGSYVYRKNSSESRRAEFTNDVISLSVRFRY